MLNKADIAQILSDQYRKPPMIEAEAFDDAEGIGFRPLDRWGDRVYRMKDRRWPSDWH